MLVLERSGSFWNGLIASNEEIVSVVRYLGDFFFIKIKGSMHSHSFQKRKPNQHTNLLGIRLHVAAPEILYHCKEARYTEIEILAIGK